MSFIGESLKLFVGVIFFVILYQLRHFLAVMARVKGDNTTEPDISQDMIEPTSSLNMNSSVLKELYDEMNSINVPEDKMHPKNSLLLGDAKFYIPIFEHLLLNYNPVIRKYILIRRGPLPNRRLTRLSKYLDVIWKILYVLFDFNPPLSVEEFLSGDDPTKMMRILIHAIRKVRIYSPGMELPFLGKPVFESPKTVCKTFSAVVTNQNEEPKETLSPPPECPDPSTETHESKHTSQEDSSSAESAISQGTTGACAVTDEKQETDDDIVDESRLSELGVNPNITVRRHSIHANEKRKSQAAKDDKSATRKSSASNILEEASRRPTSVSKQPLKTVSNMEQRSSLRSKTLNDNTRCKKNARKKSSLGKTQNKPTWAPKLSPIAFSPRG